MRKVTRRPRLIAAVLGLAAFAGAFAITSGNGPGLDPDSMAYVGAATALAHGRGLEVPLGKWEQPDSVVELTVWPPAFPAAMAVPQALRADPLLSARVVIAASAFASVFLTALIFLGVMPPGTASLGIAAIVAAPSFTGVHMSVLSEPLFIACLALTLYAMIRGSPGLSAAGATLAVMTRYAGASAAVAAAIWFLFFEKGDLRRRALRAAISSAPAALAFLLWMIHNSRVRVVQSGMQVRYYPGIASTLAQGGRTLLSWIAPGAGFGAAIAIGFVAAVATVAGLLAARKRERPSASTLSTESTARVTAAAALLLACYLAILICSRLFVGGAIAFDDRILAPGIFLIEAALIPVFAAAMRDRRRIYRWAAATAAAVWIAAAVSAEAPTVLDSIEDGNDFAASDWRESETVQWVSDNAAGHPVFTNWPAALFFNAHRNAYDIPTSAGRDTLALFGRIVAARGGYVAAFNDRNFDYPATDSIARGAGLVRLDSLDDGVIWGTPEEKAKMAARGN